MDSKQKLAELIARVSDVTLFIDDVAITFGAAGLTIDPRHFDLTAPKVIRAIQLAARLMVGDPPGKPMHKPGFIYLAQKNNRCYKIGRSQDPQLRLRKLRREADPAVVLKHVVSCNDMVWAELFLHQRFEDRRIDGEWFALTENDVEWIASLGRLDR